jgi:DNA mismatch endonuclease, patch repair protein
VSPAVSAAMRGNRRADTRPEVAVRGELHRRGLRFRKDHLLSLPGARGVRVDIAFTRARVAVFIDGCFWHGCPDHGREPRRNTSYWGPKLARNRARDRLVTERLTEDGWRVIRIWEHTPPVDAADLVVAGVARAVEGDG